MKTFGVAALTAPFILISWLLLLATNAFTGLEGSSLPSAGEIVPLSASDPLQPAEFISGLYSSISQVFLKGHAPAALLLLVGLAVSSLAAAGFALLGALAGLVTAHLLGAESQLISAGLLGFNPVLTAIALGTVFYAPGARVLLYTLLAVVLSVIAQGAMIAALTPLGIPTLTAAFVLVTWLFLLPGLKLS